MSVVVIGLNHRTMPLDLFERMTIDGTRLPKALADLAGRENLGEVVVLSTCNRTEVYAIAERFHGAYSDVRKFLSELAFVGPDEFADHLYVHYDTEAVQHLFEVSTGLDSAVLGVRVGAADYLLKPFGMAQFDTVYKFDLIFSDNDFSCQILERGDNDMGLMLKQSFNIPWTNGDALREFMEYVRQM